MNPQFKKGVLELVVLESVRKKDMYGYELYFPHCFASLLYYRHSLQKQKSKGKK